MSVLCRSSWSQKVIEKATQKEPEKRFKDGGAFHSALGKKEPYLDLAQEIGEVNLGKAIREETQNTPAKSELDWTKHYSKDQPVFLRCHL